MMSKKQLVLEFFLIHGDPPLYTLEDQSTDLWTNILQQKTGDPTVGQGCCLLRAAKRRLKQPRHYSSRKNHSLERSFDHMGGLIKKRETTSSFREEWNLRKSLVSSRQKRELGIFILFGFMNRFLPLVVQFCLTCTSCRRSF